MSKTFVLVVFAAFSACCCLRIFLLKRRRKIGKVAFHLRPEPLHNIPPSCKVNCDISYVVHYLYLQKIFLIMIYASVNLSILVSGHRWCKKNCPLIGSVLLLESFSISVLISRIKHFSISIRCSWVD